jgi:hypothetical protein
MPSLRKKQDPDQIEGSPLLSRVRPEGSASDSEVGSNPSSGSTVHADRFDMARFSDRKEEEESSVRIILYVIVVVIIGVGLALLVRTLITQDSGDDNDNDQETEEPGTTEESSISINTVTQPDPADAPSSEDFVNTESLSIGDASATASNAEITKFSYSKFTSFARMRFGLEGIESIEELPRIVFNYSADQNTLDVVLPLEMEINPRLIETPIGIADVVSRVSYSASRNTFTISADETFTYAVTTTASEIIIDVQTETLLNSQTQTEEPDTTGEDPAPPAPTTTQPPATAQNFDNEFSRETQYVNAGVTGNTITYSETFFEDQGSFFELAWGEPNTAGNEYTPYATAELVTEDGAPYIKLTIENLASMEFEESGLSQANSPIPLDGANFVRADRTSFENGIAVIMIQLKNEADFRLVSTTTVSGQTQVLALQIRD